jgi:predicted kinase
MTATLHIMCGKMAAGKSTLARRLAEAHGAILICVDLWLQQLYPTEIRGFEDYLTHARRLKATLTPYVPPGADEGFKVRL